MIERSGAGGVAAGSHWPGGVWGCFESLYYGLGDHGGVLLEQVLC